MKRSAYRSPRRRGRSGKKTLVALATVGLLGSAGFSLHLVRWAHQEHVVGGPVVVTVGKGATLGAGAANLADQRVITSSWRLRLYNRLLGAYGGIQAGTYRFQDTASPVDVLKTLSEGRVFTPV